MIDTHTHLSFATFNDHWRDVVDRARNAGVEKMIIVGTDIASSKKAVCMAQEYESLYAAVGIHPHHVKQYLFSEQSFAEDVDILQELIQREKVVALGEVGLDYHIYKKSSRYPDGLDGDDWLQYLHMQQRFLNLQLDLAVALDKPVILHSREARDGVLDCTLAHSNIRGVFHCFDGSKAYLTRILGAGFYVSFTGNITRLVDRAEISKLVPDNRLLLETDSPFMLPHGIEKRASEPMDLVHIARYHAQLRATGLDKIVAITNANATDLFQFDG